MIEEFAQKAAKQISCDKELAERLRLEILDHLNEAVHDEHSDTDETRSAAIKRFGDPAELARDYTPIALLKRGRSTRNMAILAIVVVFVTMRLRSFILPHDWYEAIIATDWGHGLMFIDRYAFILAILIIICDMLCDKHCQSYGKISQSIFGVNRVFAFPLAAAGLVVLSALTGIVSVVSLQAGAAWLTSADIPQDLFVIPLLLLTIAVVGQAYRHISTFLNTRTTTS